MVKTPRKCTGAWLRIQFLASQNRRLHDEQNLNPECPITHGKAAYITKHLLVIKIISLLPQTQTNYLLIPKGRIIASRHYYKFRPKLSDERKQTKKKHYHIQNIIHHIRQHSNYEQTGQMYSHI
jgi:hypothetical protein